MQLVNMDVNGHGASASYHFGPFSPGLNAICGPLGSGKTTLLRWLRNLAYADYDGDHSHSEPARKHASAPLSLSLEIDNQGRRHRIGRGEQLSRNVLTTRQSELFAALSDLSGPSATEADLQALANRLGMGTTLQAESHTERQRLLARQRDLEARLDRIAVSSRSRDELLTRKRELEIELARLQQERAQGPAYLENQQLVEERFKVIEADLRDTLSHIERLSRELAELRVALKRLETTRTSVEIDGSYRVQLQQIDDRLNRWRQTLRDLKSHRDRVDHDVTDARLDVQMGDQLSTTKQPDPRAALRSLETQIVSARKQLDLLAENYSVLHDDPAVDRVTLDHSAVDGNAFLVRQDDAGRTRVSFNGGRQYSTNLPETMRNMQQDLTEACQQLARHESQAARETLKHQSEQLKRCELELLHAVEQLIEERGRLLRRIADKYHLSTEQLSLAFGDWCQCETHLHLQEWLLSESPVETPRMGADPAARLRLTQEIEALEAKHKSACLRAEDCRRQLRDAEQQRRGFASDCSQPRSRWIAEVQRRLDTVQSDLDTVRLDLSNWDERARLRNELEQLVRQESGTTNPVSQYRSLREAVNRHIAGLMLGVKRQREGLESFGRRYDLVDGIVYDNEPQAEYAVPADIVRLAMRLAIAEIAAAQGAPVSLWLDECLDPLAAEFQASATAHLAAVAEQGQQIFVLTSQEGVSELMRGQRAWVGHLPTPQPSRVAPDINRQLSALANDYEADKWYQPQVQRETTRNVPVRGEFYLSERSLIEDLPTIDPICVARCRALGVDRIGDLLDVDPYWLAEHLRIDGVSSASVTSWQSQARLLCSVRQLRPFDARLLVSIGIQTPRQLAEMHPSRLLERVERFLMTDRGRRLLRSGSNYELSRIKAWIASATGGAKLYPRSSFVDDPLQDSWRTPRHRAGEVKSRSGRYRETQDEIASPSHDAVEFADEPEVFQRESDTHSSPRRRRGVRGSRPAGRSSSSRNSSAQTPRRRSQSSSDSLKLASAGMERPIETQAKFYLELASPVVEAPSIGPRMAARLQKRGIHTVDQFLAAHPDTLASKLNLQRVDALTLRSWQEQARLVCRIPNLRGHDAQLLVACGLKSPEELSGMRPAALLSQVTEVAESSTGQRILRGSKQPDLPEVTDWIAWAARCRNLSAA